MNEQLKKTPFWPGRRDQHGEMQRTAIVPELDDAADDEM